MEAPAVSGVTDYSSLSLAARSEECRQAELHKQKQYQSNQQAKRAEKASDETPQLTEIRPPQKASSSIKCFIKQLTVPSQRERVLKEKLVNAPVLVYPSFDRPLYLKLMPV